MTAMATPSVQRAFLFACAPLVAVRVMLVPRHLTAAALQIAAPVDDHFFPAPLRNPVLLLIAALIPILTGAMALYRPSRERMRGAAVTELLATGVLLLHQATYFYATWVIGFWVAAYLVWLAWPASRSEFIAATRGPFLAQLLIAFFFLGGAVGKWTPGYWSGDVFYDVFLRHQAYVAYAQAHLGLDPPALHDVARWLSRLVVLFESALAGLILLPARAAMMVAVAAGLALWCSAPNLFEVSWLLIGLALAGHALVVKTAAEDAQRASAYATGEC